MLPLEVLDSGLGSSMGLSSRESGNISGGSNIGSEELLLSSDDLGGSGHIRDLEEASDCVTVWIVGAGGGGEASRELGSDSGQGQTSEGTQQGHHLDGRQGKTPLTFHYTYHRTRANTNLF